MSNTRVYRNITTGKISIQQRNETGNWYVVGHADDVILHNPRFLVSESGRQRVLRKQQKNVHAYVTGNLIDSTNLQPYKNRVVDSSRSWQVNARAVDALLHRGVPVTYNPYKFATFVYRLSGAPIHAAEYAEISAETGVTAA